MKQPILLIATCVLLASGCYEDNIACLDPDATNYDITADEACPDCCTFPSFSVDADRFWGTAAFSADSLYQDGADNDFRLLRFRVYLGELELVAGDATLPTPVNEIEVSIAENGDTSLTTFNANLLLLSTEGTTTGTVGRLRTGQDDLTALQGTIGLPASTAAIVPALAPASSPLTTQVGLLNFNDGNGYLTASAEYLLVATNDTVRVDLRGTEDFILNFPGPLDPLRGFNLTLEVAADYQRLFGSTDLAAEEGVAANGIREGLRNWLTVTGVR